MDAPDPINARSKFPRTLKRQERKKPAAPVPLIAFDFETTNIQRGTPRPLYLTAYGTDPEFFFDGPIDSLEHLSDIIKTRFLDPALSGVRYVAWNANNFDSYFIAAALLTDPQYVMRPYLTRGNTLRGLRVIPADQIDADPSDQQSWEFLDGIAMLGLAGTSLAKFLATFAPDYAKLTGIVDFSRESFDPENAQHRAYALRDSVGLYHAMRRAQQIMLDEFNQPLSVTMGGACIKIFKANIPEKIIVSKLANDPLRVVRDYVMRGGFCYCVDRYHGPVWKYDLNQAYAAAMREAKLPAGDTLHTMGGVHRYARIYVARVTAINPRNTIPFYYRTLERGKIRAKFGIQALAETWLTSIEVAQLRAEGWKVTIHESYAFTDTFSMTDYVNRLERVRMTCEGGPSGPIGTIVKAVGNHSYGKTVEQLESIEHLIALECPPGYQSTYPDDHADAPVEHVWFRFTEPRERDYHQPHIGSFITAHVRMVVRRAALLAPDAWLYADTDCVVFSRDVTASLDIDPKRYGAWKVEETGTVFKIIAKKVYLNTETNQGHAKGLHVKHLQTSDYDEWFNGSPPSQTQTQRNNFVSVMNGAEMFREQTRRGTAVQASIKTVDAAR